MTKHNFKMGNKNYRVKRPFAANEPTFRGKILVNPDFRNLGVLVRQGYLEELPDDSAVGVPSEIQIDNPEISLEIVNEIPSENEVAETEVPEIQSPDEVVIEQPAETILEEVIETAHEIVEEVPAPAEEVALEPVVETEIAEATEIEIVEETVSEAIEETASVKPDKEKPYLKKGDTVASLTKRYGKPALIGLAKDLKVTISTDNNKDEIAGKILASKAGKKITG